MSSPLHRSEEPGVPPLALPESFTDTNKKDPVNEKIALVAIATGLFGMVAIGFKTGLICAVIAGGLSYRNHYPDSYQLAEARIAKFVVDVKSYLEKNFPGHEKTFIMVGNYFKNVGDKAYELLRAIVLPQTSLPSHQFFDAMVVMFRSGVDLAKSFR